MKSVPFKSLQLILRSHVLIKHLFQFPEAVGHLCSPLRNTMLLHQHILMRLTCNFNGFKHHLDRDVQPQLFTREANVFI